MPSLRTILGIFFAIGGAVALSSLNRTKRQSPFICGSDPFRFYSDIPCNMYPLCPTGGFKLNVGCSNDFQCTPYSANAACIANCCCTIPQLVGSQPFFMTTTPRRFFNAASRFPAFLFVFSFFLC